MYYLEMAFKNEYKVKKHINNVKYYYLLSSSSSSSSERLTD